MGGRMKSLEENLYSYGMSDFYPFHMPGHKRQRCRAVWEAPDHVKNLFHQIYQMDITEIDGFDNLHHPEGVIKGLMNEMSAFYHTKKTYILVNGSTAGILSSISACTDIGDSILVARNCHKSVLNACYLRNLDVHYIMPEIIEKCGIHGGISSQNVDNLLKENSLIRAVVIVSPTYEGIVSDVEAIAKVVHSHGIPLIVDEAHGAHFSFAPENSHFPKSAIQCDADIVVQSIHKTLPSMTQTALLHLNSERVSSSEIERYLSIYQTSSPSYILMASASLCFHFMKNAGIERMREYEKRLLILREKLYKLKFVKILNKNPVGKFDIFDYDIGKLIFITADMNCTGNQLMNRLRDEFHLELEMSSVKYAVAMTSVMDSDEGYDRLLTALQEIERQCSCEGAEEEKRSAQMNFLKRIPLQKMSSTKAAAMRGIYRKYEDCLGYISKETLYVYPPGQAFLVAGEVIDREALDQIAWYQENGFDISGLSEQEHIFVVDQ